MTEYRMIEHLLHILKSNHSTHPRSKEACEYIQSIFSFQTVALFVLVDNVEMREIIHIGKDDEEDNDNEKEKDDDKKKKNRMNLMMTTEYRYCITQK